MTNKVKFLCKNCKTVFNTAPTVPLGIAMKMVELQDKSWDELGGRDGWWCPKCNQRSLSLFSKKK